MFKITPSPPEVSPYDDLHPHKLHDAANRALDYYLLTPTDTPRRPAGAKLFAVAADINPQALLAHAFETLTWASALTLDLSDDLDGRQRNLALAIYSLMELGGLLLEKALD